MKDTLFVSQLVGVYDAFYVKYQRYPYDQDELIDFFAEEEYRNLKLKLKLFKCNIVVKDGEYYLYDFGFDNLDDHLDPCIDNINQVRFIDMLFKRKADILLYRGATREKLKNESFHKDLLNGVKPLPPSI